MGLRTPVMSEAVLADNLRRIVRDDRVLHFTAGGTTYQAAKRHDLFTEGNARVAMLTIGPRQMLIIEQRPTGLTRGWIATASPATPVQTTGPGICRIGHLAYELVDRGFISNIAAQVEYAHATPTGHDEGRYFLIREDYAPWATPYYTEQVKDLQP